MSHLQCMHVHELRVKALAFQFFYIASFSVELADLTKYYEVNTIPLFYLKMCTNPHGHVASGMVGPVLA